MWVRQLASSNNETFLLLGYFTPHRWDFPFTWLFRSSAVPIKFMRTIHATVVEFVLTCTSVHTKRKEDNSPSWPKMNLQPSAITIFLPQRKTPHSKNVLSLILLCNKRFLEVSNNRFQEICGNIIRSFTDTLVLSCQCTPNTLKPPEPRVLLGHQTHWNHWSRLVLKPACASNTLKTWFIKHTETIVHQTHTNHWSLGLSLVHQTHSNRWSLGLSLVHQTHSNRWSLGLSLVHQTLRLLEPRFVFGTSNTVKPLKLPWGCI